jgi:hypothetical protein
MRIRISIYMTLLLASLLMHCSEEDSAPSAKSKFKARLQGTWTLEEAWVGDVAVTDAFPDMSIFIEKNTFVTAHAVDPIWPAAGVFELEKTTLGDQPFLIRRDDGVEMLINDITETTLVLQFSFTSETARPQGVSGDYTFTFSK